ncbi:hypothetical protein PR048_019704 [Dryococelus australis]|uniref:Uncharacterized protein n=1 Tax=Dryococelus australis TaxID=614101 RepID=A0ABQ9H4J9_9NEOP|nr:hypothetical protein PR048_019704 [Dryococelus australis]
MAAPSANWKTFVANRVSKIQSSTQRDNWHHVKSDDNPADLLSRGMTLKWLIASNLWWKVPKWLGMQEEEWPITATTEFS